MKAIVISEFLESAQELKPFLKDYNFDLIHYRSPLKAMDNLTEIAPDAVIINAVDFPRHWKVLSQYIRWDTPKEDLLLILLIDESFTQKEADKAQNSGVQGVVKIDGSIKTVFPDLENIFRRYKYEKNPQGKTPASKFIRFIFTNPQNETIITGLVKRIRADGLSFSADTPANISNLKENEILEQCALQINSSQFIVNAIVKANQRNLELDFINLSASDKKAIEEALS